MWAAVIAATDQAIPQGSAPYAASETCQIPPSLSLSPLHLLPSLFLSSITLYFGLYLSPALTFSPDVTPANKKGVNEFLGEWEWIPNAVVPKLPKLRNFRFEYLAPLKK